MEKQKNTYKNSDTLQLSFSGTIPQAYEEFLANFIFKPFAKNLADYVPCLPQQRVLELACGTGCFTESLLNRLPDDNILFATDLSLDMLKVACEKIQSQNIFWGLCDISKLLFQNESFDIVTSQFGLMFLENKADAFTNIFNVIKPNGTFIFNVWDSPFYNRIWHIASSQITGIIGPAPTSLNATGPFSMTNENVVCEMLKKTGFKEVEHYTQSIEAFTNDALGAAKGFVYGLPFYDLIIKLYPELLETIVLQLQHEFALQFGNNPLKTQLQASVFKATK